MSAAALLNRLERVSECGDGRWRAVCPAHESKNMSQTLSIRETEDGVILVNCFAGCGAGDVVAAVGLQLSDLFPEGSRVSTFRKSGRPNHYHAAAQALQALYGEALIVLIAAEESRCGNALDPVDVARLARACHLIRRAVEACQ